MPDFDFTDAIEEVARAERLKKQTAVPVDHGAELRRLVAEAGKAAEQEYRATNPGAAAYGLSAEIHSYVKRPRSFSSYAHQMVDHFLADPSMLRWSNEKLALSVGRMMGFKAPKSLLTERLTAAQKKKVEAVLGRRAISLDLKKYNTMSKIKGALLAHLSGSDAKLRFTGSIAVTDDAVIVNDKRRAIQKAKVNRIHVGKRYWLNVDALVEWLQDE